MAMQGLSTQIGYPNILDVATFGVSSLLIYSGVVGAYIDPLGWVRGFGLPTATADQAILFPCATGRNLGAGCFVLAMTFLGERKLLGIFLLCWGFGAGIADSKVLYDHPQGQGVGKHMLSFVICVTLSALLMSSEAERRT